MRHRARIIAGGPPPSAFRLGYNVMPASYYDNYDMYVDIARTAVCTIGTLNANGFVTLAPAGTCRYLVYLALNEHSHQLAGRYVIKGFPTSLTAAPAGTDVTVFSSAAGRLVVDFDHTAKLAAGQLGPDYERSPLSAVALGVDFTNPTGAPVEATFEFMRLENEARHDAGNRFTTQFLDRVTTDSNGYIRVMQWLRSIDGWVQDVADLPRDTGIGGRGWAAAMTWNGSAYDVTKSSNRDNVGSPEDLAALCRESGKDIMFSPWTMCTDATMTAYITRMVAAGIPSTTKFKIEGNGNESWIAGMPNSSYLRNNYRLFFTQVQSIANGTNLPLDQQRCAGHMALRMWKVWETALTPAKIIRSIGVQSAWYDYSRYVFDVVDSWGIHTTSATVESLTHDMTGGFYSDSNISFPQVSPQPGGDLWALMKNKAHENNAFTGGSAFAYWQTRHLAALDELLGDWDSWNSQYAAAYGAGKKLLSVYEGWCHDGQEPHMSYGSGAAHLAMQSTGTVMIPATFAMTWHDGSSITETHGSESVGQWFTDGDRVQIYHTSNAGLLRRGWFVRISGSGILLYATKADYDSNTPTTVANGTTAWVVNATRFDALTTYISGQFRDNPTLMQYAITQLRNRGAVAYDIYSYGSPGTMLRFGNQSGLRYSHKPMFIDTQGPRGAQSAFGAWAKTATFT